MSKHEFMAGDLDTERKEITLSLSEREAMILSSVLYGLGDVVQGNLNNAMPKINAAQTILSLQMDTEQGIQDFWNLVCQIHHPFCQQEDCRMDPAKPLELHDHYQPGGYL